MEFTIENMINAQRTYTGVDFPKLVREFRKMGIYKNEYIIEEGLSIYSDYNGNGLEIKGNRPPIKISPLVDKEKAIQILKDHQAGGTNFDTFCVQMAEAGIQKWITNLETMTCNYIDQNENSVICESILTE